MRESKIEQHLVKRVHSFGGRCKKWVSPGNNGVPDRIVFLFGHIFFIETKASTTKKLRPTQSVQRRDLEAQGQFVNVLNTIELIDAWIDMQVRALKQQAVPLYLSKKVIDEVLDNIVNYPRKNAIITNIQEPTGWWEE
jgi:hypothetical protein